MSNLPENQQTPEPQSPEKCGCSTWLGGLLLVAAVLVVVFIFIVKPALEERGVDVQEQLSEVKVQSQELVNSAKNRISKVGTGVAEKYNDLKKVSKDISESETAGKIKDTVENVKDSEFVSGVTEKAKSVGNDVVEKAADGGSWY